MNYEFLPEARDEFREAALYYESKEVGLGMRFRLEVSHVINRIVADPIFGANVLAVIGESTVRCVPIMCRISFERKQSSLRRWRMGIESPDIGRDEQWILSRTVSI